MHKNCLRCERAAPDNNLFCQDPHCPAELSPFILERGEWLDDIEIIRPLVILRTSALYEAQRNGSMVLLKVAHPAKEHVDRLVREAFLLQSIALRRRSKACLPRLLPGYAGDSIRRAPYGKTTLSGQLFYYCLFEHFAGSSLRDLLLKTPQLGIPHIGGLMVNLARTVAVLQRCGKVGTLHGGLCPQVVLVRLDERTAPQVLLIDLGIASEPDDIEQNWYYGAVLPAYTAPELIGTPSRATYATDVYGLGLIFNELLNGQTVFPLAYQNDADVYAMVLQHRSSQTVLGRAGDAKLLVDLANKTISLEPAERPESPKAFYEALCAPEIFGRNPFVAPTRFQLRAELIVLSVLLCVALAVTIFVLLVTAKVFG